MDESQGKALHRQMNMQTSSCPRSKETTTNPNRRQRAERGDGGRDGDRSAEGDFGPDKTTSPPRNGTESFHTRASGACTQVGLWVCPQEVPAPVKSEPSRGARIRSLTLPPLPLFLPGYCLDFPWATMLCQMFPSSFSCVLTFTSDNFFLFFIFKYVNVNTWQVLGTAAASEFLLLEALVYLTAPSGTPNPDSRPYCSGCGWKRWSKELQIKPQKSPMGECKGER